jgi:hypothetical protein
LAWLILLLKQTFRNIIHILEPLYRGQQPPIQRVLEGRHFCAVGTIGMANIIVETHFQRYITYCRIIRPRLAVPNPKVAQMQAVCGVMASLGISPHIKVDHQYILMIIVIYHPPCNPHARISFAVLYRPPCAYLPSPSLPWHFCTHSFLCLLWAPISTVLYSIFALTRSRNLKSKQLEYYIHYSILLFFKLFP